MVLVAGGLLVPSSGKSNLPSPFWWSPKEKTVIMLFLFSRHFSFRIRFVVATSVQFIGRWIEIEETDDTEEQVESEAEELEEVSTLSLISEEVVSPITSTSSGMPQKPNRLRIVLATRPWEAVSGPLDQESSVVPS